MEKQIVEIDMADVGHGNPAWIAALEAGKVLYFPNFAQHGFAPQKEELALFREDIRDPKIRNISLSTSGDLKGVVGDDATKALMAGMIGRFRAEAEGLLANLVPRYGEHLRRGATSFRPSVVENRVQSWRADDRRMHVDSFPSRPNYGERLLRVFTNVNLEGEPRVWRVGEPFEDVARRFLPKVKPYSAWQAKVLNALHVTKSLRSEYDHIMLQLHDAMKSDLDYQKNAPQVTFNFPPGCAWVCFSDQTSHAVMAGQYMMEHTLQLSPMHQYDKEASPLAILTRMQGHALV
ncbi:3-deoxy-D-manno-oct-2-ulosonic acid (Kdo) hydroxylase [Massilia sp. Root133]|uniref:Kdo hydroxylase family protein n=1 Tax=unclassified Massilia TaxID=2609279 RepID=UPI0006FE7C0D|nr:MULTISPECIES: Kdo hydroxylase family protein [unclassified Massilia]KQY16892.1 3-deoxy-D-manno-oct-2-ulosonic acid (Kdo) hydroxylase [Massilia sp. Root133]KQZ46114.1 3-deoxy-D-manno-oct-2-ulosonic acid (Kdo) hydroxylase [Massilia sp. Root1485]